MIIMNQLIEHLEDPDAAVKKAHALLDQDGILFIETPNVQAWDFSVFKKRYWGGWHTPRHWYLFNQESLSHMLTKNSFKIIKVEYLLSPNFWLQSCHHFLSETRYFKGVSVFFDVSCFPLLVLASFIDVLQRLLTGKTSNIRIIARKA